MVICSDDGEGFDENNIICYCCNHFSRCNEKLKSRLKHKGD